MIMSRQAFDTFIFFLSRRYDYYYHDDKFEFLFLTSE